MIRKSSVLLLLLPLLAALAVGAANARTIRVDCSGGGDYLTIEEGINAAADGDAVLIADGTYEGAGNCNLDFSVGLPPGQTRAITVRSERGFGNCTIDCGGSARAFYLHSGEGPGSVIKGLTITNGHVYNGGAICCEGTGETPCSPTITNCNIIDNVGTGRGGGIYCLYGSPTITNCNIAGNVRGSGTMAGGGGIYCESGSPTITNCAVTGNVPNGIGCWDCEEVTIEGCTVSGNLPDNDVHGGGICCCASWARITNCKIEENHGAHYGGGVYISSSDAVISGCTISGNTSVMYAGGIYCYSDDVEVRDCDVVGNSSGACGGGILGGDLVVNCTISGNSTACGGGGDGGGIRGADVVMNCTITGNQATYGAGISGCGAIINCFISDNWAYGYSAGDTDVGGRGGGVYIRGSARTWCTITNCTILGNTALSRGSSPGKGGGVYAARYLELMIQNCILWGNTTSYEDYGPQLAVCENYAGYEYPEVTVSHSDVQGGEDGVLVGDRCVLIWDWESNMDEYPLFIADGLGNCHLTIDSPCIDAGDNDADIDIRAFGLQPLPETDLDDNPRIVDGDGDGGPVVDMGAREYQGPTTIKAWSSVRFHGVPGDPDASADLAIELDETADPSSAVTEPRLGGIQKVWIEFDQDVTGYYIPAQVPPVVAEDLRNGCIFRATDQYLTDGGKTFVVEFGGGLPNDQTCYRIDAVPPDEFDCDGDGDTTEPVPYLFNLEEGADTDCVIGALVGDVDSDGNVTLTDYLKVKDNNGFQPPWGELQIRCDVDVDYNLTLTDYLKVKAMNGHTTGSYLQSAPAPPPADKRFPRPRRRRLQGIQPVRDLSGRVVTEVGNRLEVP